MAKGIIKEKAKPKRPVRDEYVLEELGERLIEAKAEETAVALNVFGYEELVRGTIVELDPRTRMVHVEQSGDIIKVPFLDIMKVSNAEY